MTGRWKMLHYYARNFFANVITSPFQMDNGDIGIYIVSDDYNLFAGNLRVRFFTLDNMFPLLDYQVLVVAVSINYLLIFLINCLLYQT